MDGTQYRYLLPELARAGYRGIAVDLPGHGKSDVSDAGPLRTTADFADFLVGWCRASGIPSASVVGCSVGGDIGLSMACRHTDFVQALIACESADETRTAPTLFLSMGLESSGAAGWNDMFVINCDASTGSKIPSDRMYQLRWRHRVANHFIGTCDLLAWNSHDIRDSVRQIQCPTLLVLGADDFFVPVSRVERTAASIADCRLVILDGVGHYPIVEDQEFPALALKFLHECSLRPHAHP
jgi:pimeloyl-ACP methyl ester carboxylesterase